MDLDPLQLLLFVILLNVNIISADDLDFRRNLIRTRLRPSLVKKELRGPSSEGSNKFNHQIFYNKYLSTETRRVKVKRRRHPVAGEVTRLPSLVKASLSSPPLSNETLDYSFRPDLKPFSVSEAVHPKPDVVRRCEYICQGSVNTEAAA